MKKNNFITLYRLYLSYLFSKTTIIVFTMSFILVTAFLLLFSNFNIEHIEYVSSYNDIHTLYFQNSLFIVQLFNSIIASAIVIQLFIFSESFDFLFISYNKRIELSLVKLLVSFTVVLFMNILEIIILFVIPLFRYDYFNVKFEDFKILIYIFFQMITEVTLSALISEILKNIFVPMVIAFSCICLRLLSHNMDSIYICTSKFIPIIEIKDNIIYCESFILTPLWVILFALLYISLYNIKDLKNI